MGLTHVLDKGASPAVIEGLLTTAGDLVDIAKIGWGIAYVDRALKLRITLYREAEVIVSLGGTLLEIAVGHGRVDELVRWAAALRIDAVEVSNGLSRLPPGRKQELIHALSADFLVFAEAGSKDPRIPIAEAQWAAEMASDLEAGARWVIAEGRESGTVGLYEPDGRVRGAGRCDRGRGRAGPGDFRGAEPGTAGLVHPPLRAEREPRQHPHRRRAWVGDAPARFARGHRAAM
jgi:phosphosulfolactate synthase